MAVPSLATTLTVTSTTDSGTGSLRAALASAANGDTINFSLTYPATITLTSGPLTIGTSLAISGPGAANLFISGNNATTVFLVNSVTAAISGVTIENGVTTNYDAGGGITNDGTLTVSNSAFSGNSTRVPPGGGGGGGVFNDGTLTVINSTFSGNSAVAGGGIYNTAGTATVSFSTFSANSGTYGGGIESNATLTLKSTLLAGQTSGGNCYMGGGTATSDGYNLSDDSICTFLTATGDQNDVTNAATYLGPLQNNGGPTSTFALLSGSTAIDEIPYGSCTDANGNPVLTDQRGIVRAGNCDIGAFEVQAIANVCPNGQSTPAPCSYTQTVTFNVDPGVCSSMW